MITSKTSRCLDANYLVTIRRRNKDLTITIFQHSHPPQQDSAFSLPFTFGIPSTQLTSMTSIPTSKICSSRAFNLHTSHGFFLYGISREVLLVRHRAVSASSTLANEISTHHARDP